MGITHLLDTNICIHVIRQRTAVVLRRLQQMAPGTVGISSITVSELEFGAAKSREPERNRLALQQFLLPLELCDYGLTASAYYGQIRLDLERARTPIGPLDTLIAAHARSLGAILVTNNVSEFQRVSELTLEDWTKNL